MKKIFTITFIALFLSGCGINPFGYMGHSTNTQVVLGEANYKIVASVQGEATSSTLFGIGPTNKKLYAKAKSDLYSTLHNKVSLKESNIPKNHNYEILKFITKTFNKSNSKNIIISNLLNIL